MPKNVTVVDHPFISDSLTHLRNKHSGTQKFRHHSDKICNLLFTEAIRGLDLEDVTIETPLKSMKSKKLIDEIIIVPVLRSGIAMLFGAMTLLPKSKIGFVGLERDEETAIAAEYYWKLPPIHEFSVIIVTDPMLATGGSIAHVIEKVEQKHPKEIRIVSVVAAPEGIRAIKKNFPQVKVFTGAIDDHLNDRAFIVPGLGDYGDRYFGTQTTD